MLSAQKVVDRLYWREGCQGNFDKNRVPVAHRTVPQPWQLQGLKFFAVTAFLADETSLWIRKLQKVE